MIALVALFTALTAISNAVNPAKPAPASHVAQSAAAKPTPKKTQAPKAAVPKHTTAPAKAAPAVTHAPASPAPAATTPAAPTMLSQTDIVAFTVSGSGLPSIQYGNGATTNNPSDGSGPPADGNYRPCTRP